jgi:hypothetical protein
MIKKILPKKRGWIREPKSGIPIRIPDPGGKKAQDLVSGSTTLTDTGMDKLYNVCITLPVHTVSVTELKE